MRERKQSRRAISKRRKGLYTLGVALQVLGALLFIASFFGFACAGKRAVTAPFTGNYHEVADPLNWWFGAVVGVIVLAIGGFLRHIGARGIAGGGLVLDPDRAREDLSPWARAGGGLLKDALDQSGLGSEPTTQVRVRCKPCGRLNEEDARFCSGCGAAL